MTNEDLLNFNQSLRLSPSTYTPLRRRTVCFGAGVECIITAVHAGVAAGGGDGLYARVCKYGGLQTAAIQLCGVVCAPIDLAAHQKCRSERPLGTEGTATEPDRPHKLLPSSSQCR